MPVQLLSSIKGSLGNDAGYTRTAENEIAIVNFRDDKTGIPFARTDEQFIEVIEKFVQDHASLGISEHGWFFSQGEYGNVQNWKSDSAGNRIANKSTVAGRPGLLAWIRDRRDAFNRLLGQYTPAYIVEAERVATDAGLLEPSAVPATFYIRSKR